LADFISTLICLSQMVIGSLDDCFSDLVVKRMVVIVFGLGLCHVPEEMEPCPFIKRKNWRAVTSFRDSGVDCMSDILAEFQLDLGFADHPTDR